MINLKFSYDQEIITLNNCDMERTMKDVAREYVSLLKKPEKLFFLVNGTQIKLSLTLKEIFKNEKDLNNIPVILVQPVLKGFSRTSTFCSKNNEQLGKPINIQDNQDQLLPIKEWDEQEEQEEQERQEEQNIEQAEVEGGKEKYIFFKIFLIIVLQKIPIILVHLLFLIFQIRNIFIEETINIIITLIPTSIVYITLFTLLFFLHDYINLKRISWLLLYNFIYVVCMILFIFLLTNYVKIEIIIGVLSIVTFTSFCMMFFHLFYDAFHYIIIIIAALINIGGSILFYFFWIKDVKNTIAISVASIIIISFYFIAIYCVPFKSELSKDYLFLIFTLNYIVLFFILGIGINLFDNSVNTFTIDNIRDKKKYHCLMNLSLFLEYLFIFIIFNVIVSNYEFDKSNFVYLSELYNLFLSCLIFYETRYKGVGYVEERKCLYFIYIILFLIFRVISLNFYAAFLTKEIIHCYLFTILMIFLIREIYSLYFIEFIDCLYIFLQLLIFIGSMIFCNIFYLHDIKIMFYISIPITYYIIYLNIVTHKLFKKFNDGNIIICLSATLHLFYLPLGLVALFVLIIFYNIRSCKCKCYEDILSLFNSEEERN